MMTIAGQKAKTLIPTIIVSHWRNSSRWGCFFRQTRWSRQWASTTPETLVLLSCGLFCGEEPLHIFHIRREGGDSGKTFPHQHFIDHRIADPDIPKQSAVAIPLGHVFFKLYYLPLHQFLIFA